MPRRVILTARQRATLFDLPTDEATILRHYIFSDADLALVKRRQGAANQIGFGLQLCAFRYPGRLIQPGEVIPEAMLDFVAGQLGVSADEADRYAVTGTTRYRHSADLQRLLGYRPCSGRARDDLIDWLIEIAGSAKANVDLAAVCIKEMRRRKIIVPAPTTVERLCASALTTAESQTLSTIASRLDERVRARLAMMLTDTEDGRTSQFVWLRRYEVGKNTADMHRLLDRLDLLNRLGLKVEVINDLPRRQIDRLRGEGERLSADHLKKLPPTRRFAIMVVSLIEWRASLLDAIIETQDRLLGKIYREAQQQSTTALENSKTSVTDALKALAVLTKTLVNARQNEADIEEAVQNAIGWERLPELAADVARLTTSVNANALDHISLGYGRVRRYAPRLLTMIRFQGCHSAGKLLAQVDVLRAVYAKRRRCLPRHANVAFASPKWQKRIVSVDGEVDPKLWEIGILFALKDRLRAGDIWVSGAKKYDDLDASLLPVPAIAEGVHLTVPTTADDWIEDRTSKLTGLLQKVGEAANRGLLTNASIGKDGLHLKRLERDVPEDAADTIMALYRRMPPVRITDLLRDVECATGFADAFTELRTGAPPRDKLALLTALLADGLNMGLKPMARACPDFSFWTLSRMATWHVRQETYDRALAMVVEAQSALPMARFWGEGRTSSSDGQFFPSGGQGEAFNLINAKYGSHPGAKLYTHVSDQYAPYHVKKIAATAFEAPYILDGLMSTAAGQCIREHFTDTGGFTDHVFAVAALLGFIFAPRIRGLADKRLYVIEQSDIPSVMHPLIGGKIRTSVIQDCWPDILRMTASIVAGHITSSHLLRRLSAYPKRNTLAIALREVGRIERSIFILTWLMDQALQRRQQIGLNKGEAHHALKSALCLHRRGEIRDRTSDRQAVRAAGLNFLTATVIYHNTAALGRVVTELHDEGSLPDPSLLAHASPLGWEHINLTGEYQWSRQPTQTC